MLAVVVFDDEARTSEFLRSLRALHDQGRITVYAAATLARSAAGTTPVPGVSLGKTEAATGPSVGAAVGALVSLLDGPLAAAMKAVPLGLVGVIRDLDDAGLNAAFLERVSDDLPPGGGVVLAEVEEIQLLLLDVLSLEHGGRLLRQRLAGAFAERPLIAEIQALRHELARLEVLNPRQVSVGQESVVSTANLHRSKGIELASAIRRARNVAAGLRREAAAKRRVFDEQAARLGQGKREVLHRRAAVVETRMGRRAELLERAAAGGAAPKPGGA
jgi:uncharacterized membrane protein